MYHSERRLIDLRYRAETSGSDKGYGSYASSELSKLMLSGISGLCIIARLTKVDSILEVHVFVLYPF